MNKISGAQKVLSFATPWADQNWKEWVALWKRWDLCMQEAQEYLLG